MNEELKGLYKSDIKSRNRVNWNNSEEVERIKREDKKRKARVQALLDEGKVITAADYYHAALIFQHGDNSSDYKKANELAKVAMDMGDEKAKWLYAASSDRWLLSVGKPQKFGTQFVRNSQGEWESAQPLDPLVTDEERAKYNVPPLSKALQAFREKYKHLLL